jgi:CubicO group peptidase (beta-lactamase class C family)
MSCRLRTLLVITIIAFGGIVFTLTPTTASASATLQIVQGSNEFETLVNAITVTQQEVLHMQWTTDQAGATGGTWQVRQVTSSKARTKVIASGESGAAPAAGHFARFTIPGNAFLQLPPPAAPVKFNITIVPHNAANQAMGSVSAADVVSQVPAGQPPAPVDFGPNAVFPSVEVVSYDEKIGVVPLTQLHFAGADVTVFIKNKGKLPTDPLWLAIKDNSLLMKLNTPVSVPSLKPGASMMVNLHLDAILPLPKSQLPAGQQYSTWNTQYSDRCGVDLHAVMDWRGPQAQTPISPHAETVLLPNTPICDSTQCVRTCQIEKNLHKELDGNVVGYSYFVGLYPKYGAGGKARTSADGAARDFTSATEVTVASVSKIVTAIAAMRILDKKNVSLDAKIGPYLPSDWSAGTYVKNLTFAQLLGQRSGIKDYGNVANDYATLKKFYTQSVSNSSTSACDAKDSNGNFISAPMGQGFTPGNMDPCYSNFNFSIMRILLPKVAGFAEDSNQSTRPQTLADQYVKLVQQNVFDLVGQPGVSCKPPSQNPGASNFAFAYKYPGNSAGQNWGDNSLTCGAAGWYLSAEDMAKVLLSINAKDGKIFTETAAKQQFDDMRKRGLGLDKVSNAELEKNGVWSAKCDSNGKNCALVSTSVAFFGPVTGPRLVGVLFLNSDISGGPSNGGSAKSVLNKAYNNALTPK